LDEEDGDGPEVAFSLPARLEGVLGAVLSMSSRYTASSSMMTGPGGAFAFPLGVLDVEGLYIQTLVIAVLVKEGT
jgi:hypothetical protein